MQPEAQSLVIQLQRISGEWVDVGVLWNHQANNWFEILPGYWEQPTRPVLGQIFEEHGRSWRPRAHVALPRWFSHLLPEGALRSAVSEAASVDPVREFELLRRLGPADLQGAVRAVPVVLDGDDYEIPPLAPEEFYEDGDPLLKFSLAGTQLKYSVFATEGKKLTVPARGLIGNVIAKLPDLRAGFDGVPEAEMGSLKLAEAAGIEAAKAELVGISDIEGLASWAPPIGNSPVLAVHRFDRLTPNQRVHMEEMAQIVDIATKRKYSSTNFEGVAALVASLAGVESVSAVIDRLVLNVLVGNGDAHLKNWAFLYRDGQNPTLSPAYDIVPTVLYIPGDNLGMNLNRSKRFEDVDLASFDRLAVRTEYGISESRHRVQEAVTRILDNWSILKDYLPSARYRILTDRLESIPLSRRKSQ